MKELLKLKRENEEFRKENLLLKKRRIFCKGNRLEAYRFIEQYQSGILRDRRLWSGYGCLLHERQSDVLLQNVLPKIC